MFENVHQFIRRNILINRYTITVVLFFIWMLIFDRFNIFNQWYLQNSVEQLEQEIEEYNRGYEATLNLKNEVDQNLEKFAREEFYMHKPDEEVFIFKK